MSARVCLEEGCEDEPSRRWLCNRHYLQRRRDGAEMPPKMTRHDALPLEGPKRCPGCERELPREAFHRNGSRRDGLQIECRECSNARLKDWRARNPEQSNRIGRESYRRAGRNRQLQRLYGLTEADRERLALSQGRACAICQRPETEAPRIGRLHVDHDHATGAVRGLLCFRCNTAIGKFGDDPEVIRRAVAYLLAPPADRLTEEVPAHLDAA